MGLAALIAGAVIAATYFNAGVGRQETDNSTPREETPDARPNDDPKDRPAIEDALALPDPPGWVVSIYDTRGERSLEARSFVDELEFSFEGAPLPELADDNWLLVAEWGFDAPAGTYGVRIGFAGGITISVDGMQVVAAESMEDAVAAGTFQHAGGLATLRIELADRGGQANVEWLALHEEP